MEIIPVTHTLSNIELEARLLEALKTNNSSADLFVVPDDFTDSQHRLIFETLQAQGNRHWATLGESFPSESPSNAPLQVLARALHILGRFRRLSALIDQSYQLQQQELRSVFPQDDLADEQEQADLTPEEREARENRRADLRQQASDLVQLMIVKLRTGHLHLPETRPILLFHLAGVYEMATLIGPEVVQGWAEKLDVRETQARSGALLKIQAQETHQSRSQIMPDLLAIDQAWHDLLQTQVSENLLDSLSRSVPRGYYLRDRLASMNA
ncbi:MAG: hypothetical protein H0V70_08805 [Ktedonobacteraceae bacterium]|nr:hypothetical protein [Ktedonobacteraceae bacterium]